MQKIILSLAILVASVSFLHAQQYKAPVQQRPYTPQASSSDTKGFDKSRLFVGGSFGLSFGDYTLVNISPQVGYRFSKYFAAGAGINGQYTSYNENYFSNGQTSQQYGLVGLNVFGRVYPIEYLFIQAQPEADYYWGSGKDYYGTKYTIKGGIQPALLIGAGGVIPTGGKVGISVMAQYDVLGSTNGYLYGKNVFFNIGAAIGL